MYWPDRGSGVDVEPDRKPVVSAIRQFFTEGGPGVAPTVPGGDWFNQVTNELLNVLAAAGIDPSKVEDDQILQAVRMVSNSTLALESIRRACASVGVALVDGSFEDGGTVFSADNALLYRADGKPYVFNGVYPPEGLVVSSGSFPNADWSVVKVVNQKPNDDSKTYLSAFSGDDTSAFNLAVQHALSGERTVVVDVDSSTNGQSLSNQLTQIALIGQKTVKGPYRKKVVDEFRQPFTPVNTINPEVHLKSLRTTTSPVVVIMGDSISTEGPNTLTCTDTMWSCIKEKLARDNPSKNFTFYNRAIGGQTWLNANLTPTAFPYWYTNTSNDWLTYIEALQPDVLFLAFGMNDSNGFNSGALFSTINKIKAWAKVPDIVFVTNPVPAQTTIYPDGTGFGFVGQTFQEGRDYAAGYARNYANHFGYGVIDINRAMVAMRDCYDVTSGIMHKIESVAASSYIATRAANDFSFNTLVNGAVWAEGKTVAVKCGPEALDFLFIKKSGGNFVFEGYVTGLATYDSIATGVAVPTGSFGLEVSIIGGVARLLLDPLTSTENRRVLAEFKVIRHGGIFLPVIGWQGESGGPFTSIQYSSAFDDENGDAKYKQSVTDTDVWGVSALTADTKEPYGGNGINHYSAEGLALVVRPAIEACDFGVGETLTGVHAGGRWIKHADGVSEYSKTITITGAAITTSVGAGFIQDNPIVDTDFPAIFMSDGASGYVFEYSIHALTSSASFVWSIADGSSTLNNAIRYRLASFTSVTTNVTAKITMIGRWK